MAAHMVHLGTRYIVSSPSISYTCLDSSVNDVMIPVSFEDKSAFDKRTGKSVMATSDNANIDYRQGRKILALSLLFLGGAAFVGEDYSERKFPRCTYGLHGLWHICSSYSAHLVAKDMSAT